jgi:hypothetical protein
MLLAQPTSGPSVPGVMSQRMLHCSVLLHHWFHWLHNIFKWTHTGALCQQNKGTVETKQKPATVGAGHSPKGTPFQTVISKQSHLWKVLRKRRINQSLTHTHTHTHILCDCEATAYLRFHSMGYSSIEPSDCHDDPVRKALASIRGAGLAEG